MLVVGVVVTSERKSNAEGPGEDHAFVTGALDVESFSAVDSIDDLESEGEAVVPLVVAMIAVVWIERREASSEVLLFRYTTDRVVCACVYERSTRRIEQEDSLIVVLQVCI